MKVKVMLNVKGQAQVSDILNVGQTTGTMEPYVNKITGESDPIIHYAKGHFVHVSTVQRMGGAVVDAETLESVEMR